ncbi:2Fe-2S iron-sulfur cluster-binding protein [soil metagenome]
MSYRVHWLETNANFEVQPGETVLGAARRHQVELPHQCELGGCGSCRVKLLQGRVAYEEMPFGLTPEEAEEGFALACQAQPECDLIISVEPPMACAEPACMEATIAGLDLLSPSVVHLRLDLPAESAPVFRPGQYMDVLLEDGQHRSFSMASRPAGDAIDFHVQRIAGGQFTEQQLGRLKIGDRLAVKMPQGNFHYHAQDYRPILMVATGTGLAPLKSMLEALMDDPDCPPVSLYWGARTQADLYLHDDILSWAARLYEFNFVPVLSQPDAGWPGRTGYVQQAVLEDHADLSEHGIYLCGSPAMIADAKTAFAGRGASFEHVYADSFEFQLP